MEITGRVALVTGGGSGIGRTTALALAAAGAQVAVVDIDELLAAETERLIRDSGGEAFVVRADVSRPEAAQAMVAAAEERYGGLDIVHNNAGIPGEGFADTPVEKLLRVVEVNFLGVLLGIHAALPALQRRGGGGRAGVAGRRRSRRAGDEDLSRHAARAARVPELGCDPLTRSVHRAEEG